MENTLTPSPTPRLPGWFSTKALLPVILALLLLLAAAAYGVWSSRGNTLVDENGFPLNPAIEEKFGVRFTFAALVARHGLLDLRYRVVDAGKAANFGHYTETSPFVINETTGEKLDVTKMGLHNHRVEQGRQYYILYRNTGNTVSPGDLITIQIGDLTLEHIPVH
jgi:hypothetical protein